MEDRAMTLLSFRVEINKKEWKNKIKKINKKV